MRSNEDVLDEHAEERGRRDEDERGLSIYGLAPLRMLGMRLEDGAHDSRDESHTAGGQGETLGLRYHAPHSPSATLVLHVRERHSVSARLRP